MHPCSHLPFICHNSSSARMKCIVEHQGCNGICNNLMILTKSSMAALHCIGTLLPLCEHVLSACLQNDVLWSGFMCQSPFMMVFLPNKAVTEVWLQGWPLITSSQHAVELMIKASQPTPACMLYSQPDGCTCRAMHMSLARLV